MSYALDHIEQISLFAGTHNEESCMLLLTLIEENTSVAGQTHRELELIRKEISQRKRIQSD
jgi:hypothetical protein